jgi:hypothetical protein
MGSASKQSAISRLRTLDRADSDRFAKEHIRNEIESAIYRIRELAADDMRAMAELVQFSDWLEEEAHHASLLELKNVKKDLDALAAGNRSLRMGDTADSQSVASSTTTTVASASSTTVESESTVLLEDDEEDDIIAHYNPLDRINQHFADVMNLIVELEVDPSEDLNLDLQNLDSYATEAMEDESAKVKYLRDARDALKKVLKSGHKGMKDSERQELQLKLEENSKNIKEVQEIINRNIDRRFGALRELILNAVKSKSVSSMMAAKTETPVHEDL